MWSTLMLKVQKPWEGNLVYADFFISNSERFVELFHRRKTEFLCRQT